MPRHPQDIRPWLQFHFVLHVWSPDQLYPSKSGGCWKRGQATPVRPSWLSTHKYTMPKPNLDPRGVLTASTAALQDVSGPGKGVLPACLGKSRSPSSAKKRSGPTSLCGGMRAQTTVPPQSPPISPGRDIQGTPHPQHSGSDAYAKRKIRWLCSPDLGARGRHSLRHLPPQAFSSNVSPAPQNPDVWGWIGVSGPNPKIYLCPHQDPLFPLKQLLKRRMN